MGMLLGKFVYQSSRHIRLCFEHLSNKQLQKLSKWMTKNTMPMRGAETRDLGESQHDTSDSVGSQAYRIADLHYAVLSIFG